MMTEVPTPNIAKDMLRAESVRLEDISVFITSWNMGNAEGKGWEHIFAAAKGFDLITIGLQESTYSLKGVDDCKKHLGQQLTAALGSEYFEVTHCDRAQLQLYVFAKTTIRDRIHNIELSAENTGFLHVFPNKGGLLITLEVDGTRLAFVSCHLTAHEGVNYCEQRNASIAEILGGVRAGDKDIDVTEQFHHIFWMGDMNYRLTYDPATPANTKKLLQSYNEKAKGEEKTTTVAVVNPSEVQLDVEKTGEEEDDEDDDDDDKAGGNDKKAIKLANRNKIMDMIVKEQWEELLKLDELNRELNSNRILNEFIALQPSFPPTFKRIREKQMVADAKTGKWKLRRAAANEPLDDENTVSKGGENIVDVFYHRKRIPSFTDRILYKSMSTFHDRIHPTFFTSCEAASSSDHKPVRAGFTINVTNGARDIYIDRNVVTHGIHRAGHHGQFAKFLRFKVTELRGYDLEEMDSQMFGGGSDPYIVFRSDPPSLLLHNGKIDGMGRGVTGPVINHNLNPVWKDPMFLDCASADLEGLARNATLIMQVFDKDQLNADDLIGVVTFPFRAILTELLEEQRPFEFNTVIRSNSEVMGRVSGKIELEIVGMHTPGGLKEVLEACALIARSREHLHAKTSSGLPNANVLDLMTLAAAEKSAVSSVGCGCTIQ